MELRFWAATDTGRVRDHNEDNFLVDQNLQLFVVCDGMGGHAAGEVASAVCVRTVREVIAAQADLLAHIRDNPTDEVANERLKQLLRTAIQSACARIFEMAKQDPSKRGMGTTCVALVMAGRRGFVAYVGDSRIYRMRHGQIEQITTDHSLLNEMIRQGKVAPGTKESEFPHKNAVTRAVGVRESVDVDAFTIDVVHGDRLLMCSDGLNEYFDEGVDLVELMGEGNPEGTVTRCINFANQAGGKDNITVVVVDCDLEVAKEEAPQRAQVIEILRRTAYFHYLSPPELEKVRRLATRLNFDADEVVMGEGENDDRFFLILKGSVSLQLDGEQVSVLTTGENFGEMALIDAQDEQDTNMVVQSLEPSVFLTIERDQFMGLLRTAPSLAIKLLWNFVQVFADRLQSVPPEYRFTPDEWRRDPEAIADATPPSGTLVFEEDLARAQDTGGQGDESSDAVPPLPPSQGREQGEAPSGFSAGEQGLKTAPWAKERSKGGSQPPDLPPDLRKTIGLDDLDVERLQEDRVSSSSMPAIKDSLPPEAPPAPESPASSASSPSGARRAVNKGDGTGSTSRSGTDRPPPSSNEMEAPSVSFNRRPSGTVPKVEKQSARDHVPGAGSDGGRQDLRQTVQLDWDIDTQEGRNLPGQSGSMAAVGSQPEEVDPNAVTQPPPGMLSSEEEDAKTAEWDAEPARKILKEAADNKPADESSSAGGRSSENSSEQQRVMVSPDLLAEPDDEA